MDRRCWGSPACFWLAALVFELIYLAIFLTCRANPLAAAGGFVVCDVLICLFLFAYAASLRYSAEFPPRVVYYCMLQSVVAGFGLGVPISIGIFRAWKPWGYFVVVWAITLVVNFVFDFLLVGMHWYRMPALQFLIRSP
jgi:hypothetical protein